MPELPEVETVRRGLAPVMEGRRIERVEQRRADLRFPFPDGFTERLEGRILIAMGRRAKYLVADLDDTTVLIMHLGMSGSFRVELPGAATSESTIAGDFHHERGKLAAHDHVVFHMQGGARIFYNDPRRFGFMDLSTREGLASCRHFHAMGVEPTGNALSPEHLAGLFAGKTTSLKAALLDQRLIAGLGNIYVCEALWRAHLSPSRAAGTLAMRSGKPTERCRRLATSIRAVIADAIAAGGSSLRDYVHTDGSLGYFQHSFAVYGREDEPCRTAECNGTVRRIVQSGRSTFLCPICQR